MKPRLGFHLENADFLIEYQLILCLHDALYAHVYIFWRITNLWVGLKVDLLLILVFFTSTRLTLFHGTKISGN